MHQSTLAEVISRPLLCDITTCFSTWLVGGRYVWEQLGILACVPSLLPVSLAATGLVSTGLESHNVCGVDPCVGGGRWWNCKQLRISRYDAKIPQHFWWTVPWKHGDAMIFLLVSVRDLYDFNALKNGPATRVRFCRAFLQGPSPLLSPALCNLLYATVMSFIAWSAACRFLCPVHVQLWAIRSRSNCGNVSLVKSL